MYLIITKIIVSIIIVISLAEISRKINPVLGGVLNGLPLGTGLAVYFIAFEKGVSYILKGIPWGIAALAASIIFCLTYFYVGSVLKSAKKILGIPVSGILSIIAFLLCGYFLKQFNLTLLIAVCIFLVFYLLNLFIIKKIAIKNKASTKKSSIIHLIIRAAIVSAIILLVTWAGGILGSQWAGILSSFPSTLYALILILHYEENDRLYPGVIYGFSFGIITLLIFYLSAYFILPLTSLNLSYLIIYLICLGFVFSFNKLLNIIKSE